MTDTLTRPLVIDSDSHVMEPADLWTTYLEPEYRSRAIRIEEVDGVEHLLMGEQVILAGRLAGLGGGHIDPVELFGGSLKYADGCPPGSYDAHARLAMYDAQAIDAGVVFPTIGILPFLCDDIDLLSAYCRAYHRWQADFASIAPDRILAIANLNLRDRDEAERELLWCIEHGFRGVFLPPEPVDGRRPGDPHFDRLWSIAAEAGMPLCLHVVVRFDGAGLPFAPWAMTGAGLLFGFALGAPGQVMPAITTMVLDGVFDRVPNLKVICVEAGCGWAAYLMDRLDEKQGHFATIMSPLKEKPSEYIRNNVWFVAEPNERTIQTQLELVGPDRILWGSDFPHIDSHPDAIDHIHRALDGLLPEQQAAVLGENAARVFGLG